MVICKAPLTSGYAEVYVVFIYEVSRSPKVGLPISGNLGVRKSDSQYQEI